MDFSLSLNGLLVRKKVLYMLEVDRGHMKGLAYGGDIMCFELNDGRFLSLLDM